jgi:hypothetical protein
MTRGRWQLDAPRALFSLAILANAGLLFWVQLFFAKRLLPTLGGAPAIWNTCLMFYQAMLLAGYAYALLLDRLDLRRQILTHGALLLVTLAALPWLLFVWHDPGDAPPVLWLLTLLTLSLGAPLLALSAGSPLIQRWFSLSDHPDRGDPYFLYAASNIGSFMALAAYPLVLEPALTLDGQALGWKAGYAGIVVAVLGAGVWALRGERRPPMVAPPPDADGAPLTRLRRLRWVGLAFIPSSLLLGTTTHITSEIAPVPLLWVIPLALYLLTYVVAFGPGRNRSGTGWWGTRGGGRSARGTVLLLAVAGLVAVGWLYGRARFAPLLPDARWLLVAADLLILVAAGLVCHTRVARDRPDPRHLAEFYLWIAVGGALGGVFNTLVAPVIFTDPLEYPLMVAVLAFVVASGGGDRAGGARWSDIAVGLIPGGALLALGPVVRGAGHDPVLLLLAAGVATLLLAGRPVRFGTAVAALVFVGFASPLVEGQVVHRDRTFFGIHRVYADGAGHWLAHGATIHGGQWLDRPWVPLTYYHPSGPAASLFAWLDGRGAQPGGESGEVAARVAVVGLGTGSLMAYARAGQAWTFYELDPHVAAIAEDPALFTYLRDAPAPYRTRLGDARLSLEEPGPSYDLLVIDAFSSDAIPVHLMTVEAVELYLSRLRPGGVMAFHISNRYADFSGVMAELAGALGLVAMEARDPAGAPEDGGYPSHWAVLTREPVPLPDPRWQRLSPAGRRPWTDSYSSLLPVLRW